MGYQALKTGCQAKLDNGDFAYGDLFADTNGQMLMRVCEVSETPRRHTVHLDVTTWDYWWGRGKGPQDSTLVMAKGQATYRGYEGRAMTEQDCPSMEVES